jgi:hypothetical protein
MTEKKPTIAGLQAHVNELIATLRGEGEVNATLRQQKSNLEKSIEIERDENRNLRDELHRLTIENARLEGYRDRVIEFDPVTERQEYQDELNVDFVQTSHHGTPPRRMHTRRIGRVRGSGAEAYDDMGSHMPSAGHRWYHRRG